ncbi:hypothetical protein PsYK624_093900 [Phanerochaete sordida]|uniref:F-box domain-containing protein n=1 Tax=Phanerochaete sordida TaxID=48140 RepID=A0A9P3GE39_9APHY|nr:hypothetical protein PsYK624_093900 [Phanerochaete sordida]
MGRLRDLPNELLLLILAHLDDTDLLQHVCYFKLCARTRACFARAAPGLWRRLVRANGLGLNCLEKATEKKWKKVAFECAEHAWACDDPECGVDRLEENRETIKEMQEYWPEWDHSVDAVDLYWNLRPTSLFAQIGFNDRWPHPDADTITLSSAAVKCAFLKPNNRDLMEHHPIALRTFATIPPLESLVIDDVGSWPSVTAKNAGGATVHDALIAMSGVIGKDMTCTQLDKLMAWCGEDGYFPTDWSFRDILSATSFVGTWFQLTDWEGLELDSSSFICQFGSKRLPYTVREHLESHYGHRYPTGDYDWM